MQDAFEPAQRLGLPKNPGAQRSSVDAAGLVPRPGEGLFHKADRSTSGRQQTMHLGVGVEQRQAHAPEHCRRGALAHPDRAGQAEDDHRSVLRVVRTAERSSRVTRTGAPNQASNPGRPWCNSMPRPSTTRLPRRRAAASSGVSSGT